MSAKSHSFKLGAFDCWVLLDGQDPIDTERFVKRFPDANEADYRGAFADIGLKLEDAENYLNILLVKMGDDMVLFDTGQAGMPVGGDLPESMKLAGIEPEAVTKVVITHCHGDHILGLLKDGEAAFPNADYVISKEEMAFWQGRIDGAASDQAPIVAMMQEKGLRLIEMDEEIMLGLTAIPIPGHTPGQIALRIESEGETLLHLADLLHSPIQFAHPEWSAKFDADTSVSVPTRRDALKLAADEEALTFFYHLAFPSLGHVGRAETGFSWQPE